MVDPELLKASVLSGEARYRQALERLHSIHSQSRNALERVDRAKEKLWKETVHRQFNSPCGVRSTERRDRLVGGASSILAQVGKEKETSARLQHELAQQSKVATTLRQGIDSLSAALANLQRKKALKRESQGDDELSDLSIAKQCVAKERCVVPPLNMSIQQQESRAASLGTPMESRVIRSALPDVVTPSRVREEGVQAVVVRVSIHKPGKPPAEASVEVVQQPTGVFSADVVVSSPSLTESLKEQKGHILRKLGTMELKFSELHVSHGEVVSQQHRRTGGHVQRHRKQHGEEDDEINIA